MPEVLECTGTDNGSSLKLLKKGGGCLDVLFRKINPVSTFRMG